MESIHGPSKSKGDLLLLYRVKFYVPTIVLMQRSHFFMDAGVDNRTLPMFGTWTGENSAPLRDSTNIENWHYSTKSPKKALSNFTVIQPSSTIRPNHNKR